MSTNLPESFVRGLRIGKRSKNGPWNLTFRSAVPIHGVVRDMQTGHPLTTHPVASQPVEPGVVQMDFTSALGAAHDGEALLYLFTNEGHANEHQGVCQKCDVEKEPKVGALLKAGLLPELDENAQKQLDEAVQRYHEARAAAHAVVGQVSTTARSGTAGPTVTFPTAVRVCAPGRPPEWEPD